MRPGLVAIPSSIQADRFSITPPTSAAPERFRRHSPPGVVRVPRKRRTQPRRRFIHRLMAELKCLVMNRHKIFCPRLIRHRDALLGTAMRANPGIVGANRHQHQIERTSRIIQPGKNPRVRGIAGEAHRSAFTLKHVAVVPAMRVTHQPRSPVRDLDRDDLQCATAKR